MSDALQPEPPEALQKDYVFERLLAQNRAATWRARRRSDDLLVIIKVLDVQRVKDWKDQELFQREMATLKQLSHPGLPAYLEDRASADGQSLSLVMQCMPGESLESWLQQHLRASEAMAIQWADQLLEILSYLHSFSPPIIHRDIKPGNMIWSGERIYLVDLGGVQALLQPEGGATVTGTYGYMAPEQFAGKATLRSDLYSLGASLVHLLTGRPPEEFLDDRLQLHLPAELGISGRFRYWLEHLTAYTPSQRFADAAQARQALAELQPLSASSGDTAAATPGSAVQSVSGLPAASERVDLQHGHLFLKIRFKESVQPSFVGCAGFFIAGLFFLILPGILAEVFALPYAWASMGVFLLSLFLFFNPLLNYFKSSQDEDWQVLQTSLNFFAEGRFTFEKRLCRDGEPRRVVASYALALSDIRAVQREVYIQTKDGRRFFRLALQTLAYPITCGENLSEAEQLWLKAEILHFLQRHLPARQAELIQLQSSEQ